MVAYLAHHLVYGHAWKSLQEVPCSCLFIFVAHINVKPLDYPSTLMGVFKCPRFRTGSFLLAEEERDEIGLWLYVALNLVYSTSAY